MIFFILYYLLVLKKLPILISCGFLEVRQILWQNFEWQERQRVVDNLLLLLCTFPIQISLLIWRQQWLIIWVGQM
jgi:hypothetical protein